MDYMYSIMIDYYTKNVENFPLFLNSFSLEEATIEYGIGGESLPRGFYCPSPIDDVVVGNISRGRIQHSIPANNSFDFKYFKVGAKLKVVDKYKRGTNNKLLQREFLFFEDSFELAFTFINLYEPANEKLQSVSFCQYNEKGKPLVYRNLVNLCPFGTNGCNKFEIHGEDYFYDSDSGLMCRAQIGKKFLLESEDEFFFEHDADGRIIAFDMLPRHNNSEGVLPLRYIVPQEKRRVM